jgi:hypothetical protein
MSTDVMPTVRGKARGSNRRSNRRRKRVPIGA